MAPAATPFSGKEESPVPRKSAKLTNDARALAPAVNDVIDSGIPIVMFDRNVDGAKKGLAYFGLDNVAGGVALAKYVMQKF